LNETAYYVHLVEEDLVILVNQATQQRSVENARRNEDE
jgi:hypothetical protein